MMRNVVIAVGLAVVLVGGLNVPAAAEHGEVQTSVDLNVDLKMTRDGFRLGGQLLGLGRPYGVWVNGEVRSDGLSLDGRVQDGARAFNFKLNADIARWLLGTLVKDPI
jgi:hypothetical protein